MSKQNRRRHSAKFKARVAMEAIKGIKTASEIAAEYEIHPVQVSEWKIHLMDNMDSAFKKDPKKKKDKDFTPERNSLQAKVGQLTMEVEWLQKKVRTVGFGHRRQIIEPNLKRLSQRRQCQLLFIARSTAQYKPKGIPAEILTCAGK
jgi:transposase-like protein